MIPGMTTAGGMSWCDVRKSRKSMRRRRRALRVLARTIPLPAARTPHMKGVSHPRRWPFPGSVPFRRRLRAMSLPSF
jgi:hypothetical protein